MTPDPADTRAQDLTNPQTWNLFAYALNNPINIFDPTGWDCVYFNDAGTAPDNGDQGIDRNSNPDECANHGGDWIDGTIQSWSYDDSTDTFNFQSFDASNDYVTLASAPGPQVGGYVCNEDCDAEYGFTDYPVDRTPTQQQQVLQTISTQVAPLGKLQDCAALAVADDVIPFGDTLVGAPKGSSDPVGTSLDLAEKLSDNKYPATAVLGLKKAGMPVLSETARHGFTKVVPHLAPFAEKLSVAGDVWAAGSAAYHTYSCYQKP